MSSTTGLSFLAQLHQIPAKLPRQQFDALIYDTLTPSHNIVDLTQWNDKQYFVSLLHQAYMRRAIHDTLSKRSIDAIALFTDPLYLPHRADITALQVNLQPVASYCDNCASEMNAYRSYVTAYTSQQSTALNTVKVKHKGALKQTQTSLSTLFDLLNTEHCIDVMSYTIMTYIGNTLKLHTLYTVELLEALNHYLAQRIVEYGISPTDHIVQLTGGDGRLAYHLTQNRRFTSLQAEYACVDSNPYKPVVTIDLYDKIKAVGDDNAVANVIDIDNRVYTALNKYKPKLVILTESTLESTKLKYICAQYNVNEILIFDEITTSKHTYDIEPVYGYSQSVMPELSQHCVNVCDTAKCYGLTRCVSYTRKASTHTTTQNPVELMVSTIDMLQQQLSQRTQQAQHMQLMYNILAKENALLRQNLNLVHKLVGSNSDETNSEAIASSEIDSPAESITSHNSNSLSSDNTLDQSTESFSTVHINTTASTTTTDSAQHTPTTRVAVRAKRKASIPLALVHDGDLDQPVDMIKPVADNETDKQPVKVDLSNAEQRPKTYVEWSEYLHQLSSDELRHCLSFEMERNITETNKITKLLNGSNSNNKTLPDKLLNELIVRCDKLKNESDIFHQLLTDHTITVFNSPHNKPSHKQPQQPTSPLLHHKRNQSKQHQLLQLNASNSNIAETTSSDDEVLDPPAKTTRLNDNSRIDAQQQEYNAEPFDVTTHQPVHSNGVHHSDSFGEVDQLAAKTTALTLGEDVQPSVIIRDSSSVTESSSVQLSDGDTSDDDKDDAASQQLQSSKAKSKAARKREKRRIKRLQQANGSNGLVPVSKSADDNTAVTVTSAQLTTWMKQVGQLVSIDDLFQFERAAVKFLCLHIEHMPNPQFVLCVESLYMSYMKKQFVQHKIQFKVDDKLYGKICDINYLPTRAELSATLRMKLNKIALYDYAGKPQYMLRRQQQQVLHSKGTQSSLGDVLACALQHNYVSLNTLYTHCYLTQQYELFTRDYIDALATYVSERVQFYGLTSDKHSIVICGFQAKQLQQFLFQTGKIPVDIDCLPYISTTHLFDRFNNTRGKGNEMKEYTQQLQAYLNRSQPSLIIHCWLQYKPDLPTLYHRSPTVLEYVLIGESTSGNCGQLYDTYNVHICDRTEGSKQAGPGQSQPACTHKARPAFEESGFEQSIVTTCSKHQISCHDQVNQVGSFSSTQAFVRKCRHRNTVSAKPPVSSNALLRSGSGAGSTKGDAKDTNAVTISVTNNVDATNLYFKIHTHKTLAPLMRVYCQRKNVTLDQILFMYNKTVLKTTDSCVSVGIRDNDTLVAIHKNNTAILDAYTGSK